MRTIPTSNFVGRTGYQNDLGNILDTLSNTITDDVGNSILVHTGDFESQDPFYTTRTIPTENWA